MIPWLSKGCIRPLMEVKITVTEGKYVKTLKTVSFIRCHLIQVRLYYHFYSKTYIRWQKLPLQLRYFTFSWFHVSLGKDLERYAKKYYILSWAMAEIHIGDKICFLPIHGTIQIPKSLHQIQLFWFHLVSLGFTRKTR